MRAESYAIEGALDASGEEDDSGFNGSAASGPDLISEPSETDSLFFPAQGSARMSVEDVLPGACSKLR
jgi:hypothetical protein